MNELEQKVRQYLEDRGWDKSQPSDIAKSISIEAAELLEVFQWSSVEIVEAKANPKMMSAIREELADVMIFCLEMAILLELNSNQIVKEKLAKPAAKYPAELMKRQAGSDSKPGTDSDYLRIKKEYRRRATEE